MRKILIPACIVAAIAIAILRPNVPRLCLEAFAWARNTFGIQSASNVTRHDSAIARAADERNSTKAIADSLQHRVVPPALERDSTARQQLRHVLMADTVVPLDVDSLTVALQV